jgi:thioredoxin
MTIITCPNCGTKNRVDDRAKDAQPVCGKCGAKLPPPSANTAAHPVVVTDDTFAHVIGNPQPVLVDFWAPWCGPCRAIAPVLEQIAAESGGRYVVGKLNVDENPRTSGQFHVDGIPTLLIFKAGKLVDRLVGAHPKQTIVQHLHAHV